MNLKDGTQLGGFVCRSLEQPPGNNVQTALHPVLKLLCLWFEFCFTYDVRSSTSQQTTALDLNQFEPYISWIVNHLAFRPVCQRLPQRAT